MFCNALNNLLHVVPAGTELFKELGKVFFIFCFQFPPIFIP